MRGIYQAVRNFLYPINATPLAGRDFAEGTHLFAKKYGLPARLCLDLMEFEQLNRGHHNLLDLPALVANSGALVIPGEMRRAKTV